MLRGWGDVWEVIRLTPMAKGKEQRGGEVGWGAVDIQARADVTWLYRAALISPLGCDSRKATVCLFALPTFFCQHLV